MAVTCSSVADRFRLIIKDTGKNSYADADVYKWFEEAVELVFISRPELRLSDPNTLSSTDVTITALSDSVALPSWISAALVDYVCYRAFSSDARDKQDLARATAHARQFTNLTGISIPGMQDPSQRV